MRAILMFALFVFVGSSLMTCAQVASSGTMGCGVKLESAMVCAGIGTADTHSGPRLSVIDVTIEPGGQVENLCRSADCIIVGINGGELVNEVSPFGRVSLEHDAVTLMPREQPFRLRNTSHANVQFRVIEILR